MKSNLDIVTTIDYRLLKLKELKYSYKEADGQIDVFKKLQVDARIEELESLRDDINKEQVY